MGKRGKPERRRPTTTTAPSLREHEAVEAEESEEMAATASSVRTALANSLGKRLGRAQLTQVRRGGGGGPVASSKGPSEPLPESDELVWDDGTVYPEPCLDSYDFVSKQGALGMLVLGMGGFAALGYALTIRDKASMKPFVNRRVMTEELNDLR